MSTNKNKSSEVTVLRGLELRREVDFAFTLDASIERSGTMDSHFGADQGPEILILSPRSFFSISCKLAIPAIRGWPGCTRTERRLNAVDDEAADGSDSWGALRRQQISPYRTDPTQEAKGGRVNVVRLCAPESEGTSVSNVCALCVVMPYPERSS